MSSSGEVSNVDQPPGWAVDEAKNELYDVEDPAVVAERAQEIADAAQEREDERHDEFDDPDQGGES